MFVLISTADGKIIGTSEDAETIKLAYLMYKKMFPLNDFKIVKTSILNKKGIIKFLTGNIEIN